MKQHNHLNSYSFWVIFLILFLPTLSLSQLIPIKTVPLATGDQFMIFPSRNLGMGGLSIAIDDPMLDPFVNPAKGIRIQNTRLFGTPTFYNITNDNGSARTFPFGTLFSYGDWFGGFTIAMQQLSGAVRAQFPFIRPLNSSFIGMRIPEPYSADQHSDNVYASGLIGMKIPNSNFSIATSLFYADIEALQGVEHLYANSKNVDQSGYSIDYRVGLLGELEDQRNFEILFIHNRIDMRHEVSYWTWQTDPIPGGNATEIVKNLDLTRTWGLHAGYTQPLGEENWKIGGIFTVNRKSHPKIPNYELMNIPRDPGYSWAFDFGVGLSQIEGPAVVGLDFILEPMWSNTWAEAIEPVETSSGRIIPAGGKTVVNDFKFLNWKLAFGIGRQEDVVGFQIGMQIQRINYWLDQRDKITESRRSQKESWVEWQPTMSLNLTFPEFQIRYSGSLTIGTGQPGVETPLFTFSSSERSMSMSNYLVAPSGSLTLDEAVVLTHQISLSIPLHRAERK